MTPALKAVLLAMLREREAGLAWAYSTHRKLAECRAAIAELENPNPGKGVPAGDDECGFGGDALRPGPPPNAEEGEYPKPKK